MRPRLLVLLSSLLLMGLLSAARAEVTIRIDKTAQRMAVSVDGQPRYLWPVSTGLPAHETPSGSFRPFRMERQHVSREWDDAPMPFSLFFTQAGHAIHGTSHGRALGRRASHGCVRLSVRNAATLFALVGREGLGRTRIVIEEGGGGLVARRHQGPARRLAGPRPLDFYEEDGAGPEAWTRPVDGFERSARPVLLLRAGRPAAYDPWSDQ
ncbi:ErfK/YbiS/YcfS/YnhG family protein [Methylobacterium sp. 4-46]|uniref:L,D-transpeptidase n=1 Tax=unclassified Methylobacterium TaxID=2615210 RepID=UPI000152D9E8|nr:MULTISPECIES: L,D-transpeptidase [Methylobacterium]ACA20194.1 ErfK/YbiS/YcfS/YnhG family protein [Methylobacterium sp. 4-46]WFT79374.1 L,D-transpeptidase [Methylobacterium nodulans]